MTRAAVIHTWVPTGQVREGGQAPQDKSFEQQHYLLEQDHSKRLHQAVEGGLGDTLGVAALSRKRADMSLGGPGGSSERLWASEEHLAAQRSWDASPGPKQPPLHYRNQDPRRELAPGTPPTAAWQSTGRQFPAFPYERVTTRNFTPSPTHGKGRRDKTPK